MECIDCERNENCPYQLDGTTAKEESRGQKTMIPVEEAEKVYKERKEGEWHTTYDIPPLGCKPAQLCCTERIKIVADAISRYADSPKFNSQLVKRWATEIELQCDIFDRC